MIKIRLVSNYTTSENLTEVLFKTFVTPQMRDTYSSIEFVFGDKYDWLFVFNRYGAKIFCPKRRVIAILQEPFWSPVYINNRLNMYCGRVYSPHNPRYRIQQIPALMYNFTGLTPEQSLDNISFRKPHKCSFVVSNLNGGGDERLYAYRHKLVEQILNSNLDIHIFGRGWSIEDERYKGELPEKKDALLDYEYSICIENSRIDDYVTEKFWDPILCNTLPIYYGAENIANIAPVNCFIDLENMDLQSLEAQLKLPLDEAQKQAILSAKEEYYSKRNIFLFIADLVSMPAHPWWSRFLKPGLWP